MVMLKAALPQIFPQHKKVLWLDCDTLVLTDLVELWLTDLEGYYLAAVREPQKSTPELAYINAGVMMMNLRELGERFKDKELIEALNTTSYPFVEQTCINQLCQGKIKLLPGDYNVTFWTETWDKAVKIRHYAAETNFKEEPVWKRFSRMPMREAVEKQKGLIY